MIKNYSVKSTVKAVQFTKETFKDFLKLLKMADKMLTLYRNDWTDENMVYTDDYLKDFSTRIRKWTDLPTNFKEPRFFESIGYGYVEQGDWAVLNQGHLVFIRHAEFIELFVEE